MPTRGQLRVYLGYAAGVGKTYRMLADAGQLRQRGADMVIGYFEPHDRRDTIAQAQPLEMVPRRQLLYRGASFTEMDPEAIAARHPSYCAVDELAHTNVAGSARRKRWEDVEWLRDQGIHVWTTVNVQHLESFNDQIWEISGVRVRETVPDWLIASADEVVMVDLTPRALRHRLERGVVYAPDRAEWALSRFFKESTLVALRELTLRQAAQSSDLRHTMAGPPGSCERILVHISPQPATAMVTRRAKRVADYLRAECYAVYVRPPEAETPAARAAVEQHLEFARHLRLEVRTIEGPDTAAALVAFARAHRIAQIFISRPPGHRWGWPRRDLVSRIVRLARDMQVTIVARRAPAPPPR